MSRKTSAFAKIITQPLNLYNFVVEIIGQPTINEKLLVVQSTSFPTEKMREIELWANGEKVRYPGIPENDGNWKIKIPENDDGSIRELLDKYKASMFDQKTGILTPPLRYDISVTSRDLNNKPIFQVILKECWLKGRESVELSAGEVTGTWNWDYTFVYNWIEDKKIN